MGIHNTIKAAIIAAGVWAASAVPAAALPTFTTGSFALGFVTDTTANLDTSYTNFHVVGNVFPDTALCLVLNGGNGCFTVSSRTGDFTLVANPGILDVTAAGDIINFGTASSLNWSDAGLGAFTAVSTSLFLKSTTGSGQSQATSVTWLVHGNFTVGSSYDNAGDVVTALETFTINQTGGAGAAISSSNTFSAPDTTRVPEPATLALLGAGLLGAGAVGRRRKAQKD